MTKRLDPEKYEANKRKFLETLYDVVSQRQGNPPPGADLTRAGAYEDDIAERMGLSPRESDRISSELQREGKIRSSSRRRGPECTLTWVGVEEVEAGRHARSVPGSVREDRRGLVGAAGGGLREVVQSVWPRIVTALVTALLSLGVAALTRQAVRSFVGRIMRALGLN